MGAGLDTLADEDDGGEEPEAGARSRGHTAKIKKGAAEFDARVAEVAARNRRPGYNSEVTVRHVDPATLRPARPVDPLGPKPGVRIGMPRAPEPQPAPPAPEPAPQPAASKPAPARPLSDVQVVAHERDEQVLELLRERARSGMAIAHEIGCSKETVNKSLARLERHSRAKRTEHSASDFPKSSKGGRPSRVWRAVDGPGWSPPATRAQPKPAKPPPAPVPASSNGHAPDPPDAPPVAPVAEPSVDREKYILVLLQHAAAHPEHEHVFDRIERILGI